MTYLITAYSPMPSKAPLVTSGYSLRGYQDIPLCPSVEDSNRRTLDQIDRHAMQVYVGATVAGDVDAMQVEFGDVFLGARK